MTSPRDLARRAAINTATWMWTLLIRILNRATGYRS
jgi:hypothetical protein